MFVRQQAWMPRRFFDQDNGGGSGGGGNPANNGGTPPNNQQQQNNNTPNEENFATLWEQPQQSTPQNQPQQQNNNNNNGNPQQQQQRTPQEIMQDHFRQTVGDFKLDAEKIARELNEGKTETLETMMSGFGQKIYQSMMLNMGTYVNQKIASAVEAAVSQATGNVNSDMVVNKMHDQLKFTADPAVAPMAKAVLGQLLKKGKSPDEAIAGVKAYYQRIAQTVGGNTGNRRPGTGNFNGGGNNANSVDAGIEEDEIDWMAALSAKSQ